MFHIPIVSPVVRNVLRAVSILFYLLMMLSAYGGRINPEYMATPSVLTLALPYFTVITGIIILYWLLCRRFIFAGIGVLAIVACAGPVGEAFPLSFPKKAAEGAATFRLMSYNILHTDDMRQPDYPGNRALEYILHSGVDIVAMAELYNFSPDEFRNATPQLIDSVAKAYPYRAGLNSTDIKIMSKYPVDRMGIIGAEGRVSYDFFKVHFPGGRRVVVAMVHLPSFNLSEKERQVVSEMRTVGGAKESMRELKGSIFQKLRTSFRDRARVASRLREAIDTVKGNLIVCGDFNDVPASWSYSLLKGDDMRDAYTETNFGPTFTYNAHLFYFHIDQVLYRGDLKALSVKRGKINTSDHYPLITEFEFTEN